MIKLEVGKYYLTRDWRKIGPIALGVRGDIGNSLLESWWMEAGAKNKLRDSDGDLIAEWIEEPTSPVRTVTRKEIVPGTYGHVIVTEGRGVQCIRMDSAAELRAAIATLTQIAEVLEESEQ